MLYARASTAASLPANRWAIALKAGPTRCRSTVWQAIQLFAFARPGPSARARINASFAAPAAWADAGACVGAWANTRAPAATRVRADVCDSAGAGARVCVAAGADTPASDASSENMNMDFSACQPTQCRVVKNTDNKTTPHR